MEIHILTDSIPERRGGLTIFHAEDEDGALDIWITTPRWEYFWGHSPAGDDDFLKLDLALRLTEVFASKREFSTGTDGVRFVFVG